MNKLCSCALRLLFVFCLLFASCSAKNDSCNAKPHTDVIGKVELKNLNESRSCIWELTPESNSSTEILAVNIFLQIMLLDEKDELVVESVGGRFGPYHGRNDAFVIVTGSTNATVFLNTSSTKMNRHIAFSYNAQKCAFAVDDNIPVISEQILPPNSSIPEECEYNYNIHRDDALHAFSFELLSIDSRSTIEAEHIKPDLYPDYRTNPPNFFSDGRISTIRITLFPQTPNHISLRKDDVNSACSGYLAVSGTSKFHSPDLPKLNNGTILGECRWLLQNTLSGSLGLNFSSLNLNSPLDVIALTDGKNFESAPFLQVTSSNQEQATGRVIRTSAAYMVVSFQSAAFKSNFSASAFGAGPSKYIFGNGSFGVSGTQDLSTAFLLEVHSNESVLLNFDSSKFSTPAFLDVYEDFTVESKKIATLHGDVWYPLVSNSSKMMIIPNNFQGEFKAEFKGIAAGCIHMSVGETDSYILTRNCNTSCSWIIPPSDGRRSNEHLSLDLQHISLDEHDQMNIYQLNRRLVANITNEISHIPIILLNATEGAYVNVTQGKCSKAEAEDQVLVGLLSYLPGYSKNYSLNLYENFLLTSPNYPDTYPVLSDSEWGLSSENALLHLTFKNLDLVAKHYLTISTGSGKQIESQTVSGSTMPDDLFGRSYALFHFNSMNNNDTKTKGALQSGQGFSVDVHATDCGDILTKPSGSFSNAPNKTLCIWKIHVSDKTEERKTIFLKQDESVSSGNFKLTVYDGASVRNSTPKFTNSFWSKSETLIVIYEKEDQSKPSPVIKLTYSTRDCNNTDKHCDNGYCMHPEWLCNGVDNCGDWTDEKNCGSVPVPPENQPRGSVSPVAYGLSIVVFFLLGLGLAYLVPVIIQKCQNRQYSSFRDVSVIE